MADTSWFLRTCNQANNLRSFKTNINRKNSFFDFVCYKNAGRWKISNNQSQKR